MNPRMLLTRSKRFGCTYSSSMADPLFLHERHVYVRHPRIWFSPRMLGVKAHARKRMQDALSGNPVLNDLLEAPPIQPGPSTAQAELLPHEPDAPPLGRTQDMHVAGHRMAEVKGRCHRHNAWINSAEPRGNASLGCRLRNPLLCAKIKLTVVERLVMIPVHHLVRQRGREKKGRFNATRTGTSIYQ